MKRKILLFSAVLLAFVMILGGCSQNKVDDNSSEANEGANVAINEKTEGRDLSVTFTEFETPTDDLGKGAYRLSSSGTYEFTKEGYVNRLAHFTVENIGKSSVDVYLSATLLYGDGYTFEPAKIWFHTNEIYNSDGTKKEGGSWVNSVPNISPFDASVECIIAFLIPEEVANGDEELSINFEYEGSVFSSIIR